MASEQAKRAMARFEAAGESERIIYRPGSVEGGPSGRPPREISGLVDRPGTGPFLAGRTAWATVRVLNDERVGIPSALMDVGADRLDLAERVGGARQTRGIQAIGEQDSDWLTLEVA